MILHYKSLGEGGIPLIILHGFLGSSDNWMTVGRQFSKSRKVILIDARNHGKSPHDDEVGYLAMAGDTLELMNRLSISKADLIGHSMGGKTAMVFALLHPLRTNKLVVVDIALKNYSKSHEPILNAMRDIPLEDMLNRKQIDEYLSSSIKHKGIRQFVMKNLGRRNDGSYYWRPNLTALYGQYKTFVEFPSLSGKKIFNGSVLWIKAQLSNYILSSDEAVMYSLFPNTQLVTISNAGHWVHAEQPVLFTERVSQFLDED